MGDIDKDFFVHKLDARDIATSWQRPLIYRRRGEVKSESFELLDESTD